MRKGLRQWTVGGFIFLVSNAAYGAFEFAPIIAHVTPTGQKSTTSFQVVNTDNIKIPVQLTIVPREPDIDGKEDLKESDKIDEIFRIYPNQLVLNPKETRTVRVTYVGNPKIQTEVPYRIIAEEIPVDLDDPNKKYTKAVARISIATRYVGSLYVTPAGTKPQVVVEAKRSQTASKSLMLTIVNKGSAHQILRKPVLKIKSMAGGKEVELSGEQVIPMTNQNVLAGRSRRFTLAWPEKLADGPLQVSLDLAKE